MTGLFKNGVSASEVHQEGLDGVERVFVNTGKAAEEVARNAGMLKGQNPIYEAVEGACAGANAELANVAASMRPAPRAEQAPAIGMGMGFGSTAEFEEQAPAMPGENNVPVNAE